MPDGLFDVRIVTPEAALVETRARAVVLRSSDGELTVLDGHTPLITDVVPGKVRVEPEEGEEQALAVHGGYLQVETGPEVDAGGEAAGAEGPAAGERRTRVTLLAGVAERAEDIDVPRAEAAQEGARSRVEELKSQSGRAEGSRSGEEEGPTVADLELDEAEAALRRAEVRLEVAGSGG
jgi:F-type H+-transporting ATPase subunit epsilon